MSNAQPTEKKVSVKMDDPNVHIPAAIRAAAARSDAIHAEAYTPPATKQPEGQQEQPKPEGQQERPQPTHPTPKAEEQPKPQDQQQEQPQNWEHSYKSIKGRYDAAQNTIQQLNNRIADLEAIANRAPQPPAPQAPNPELRFVTDQERADFGSDFIDVAQRAAREKLEPEIQSLKGELAKLTQQFGTVAQTQKQNTTQSMYAFLDDKLPNWREVNRNKEFIAWANLSDPYSGAIRLHLMKDAFDKADGQRLLNFFNGFLSDEAATDPARTVQPDHRAPAQKVPLAEFAAPGRAKAPAATQAPGDKETITRSQIANFYHLVQKGHYRGNEAEKERLERMIFEAEAEGRVVNG